MSEKIEEVSAELVKADDIDYTAKEVDFDGSGNFSAEIKAQLDLHTLKNLYFDEPWVYIAVNSVAKKLGNMLMPIHARIIKKGELVVEPFASHPLNELMEHPNPWESYYSFMMRLAIELTLMGNCIVWKLRFHNQIMVIPTENVTMDFDSDGILQAYVINGATDELGTGKTGFRILPEDIIHVKLPNPRSIHFGLSPFIPGRRPILFERYSQEYLLNFYLKQSNPGTILELGEKANEKQALRFLKSMELRYTGRSTNRRTLILPKGVSAKNYNPTFAQQELKDHIKDNKGTIRALLNIPPHEFGTQETGALGTSETDAQIVNFYEATIIPFGGLISGGFNSSFRKALGRRFVFKFDTSSVAVLREDENKNADLVVKLLPIMSPNELRMRLFNMEPHPDGDSLQSAQPEQPLQIGGQSFGQDTITEADLETDGQKRVRVFLSRYPEWWSRMKAQGEVGNVKKLQDKFFDEWLEILLLQAVEALKVVKNLPLTKSYKLKADRDEIEEALLAAFNSFAEVYTDNNVKTLQSSGEVGYDLALDVPFKLPNQDEGEILRQENAEGRRDFLDARALDNFKTVNEGTTKQVMDRIAEGADLGLSLDQIARSITEYFSENQIKRAQTIARTEVLSAVPLGQKAAEDDLIESTPGMKKMWLTAGDSRVRSFSSGDANDHTLLDGVTIKAGDDFDMPAGGKMGHPRDTKGAAGEVINCRCTLLLIPPGEDLDTGGISFTGLDG